MDCLCVCGRASLLEQQKRDEEARKKKEKEEAEAREKQKYVTPTPSPLPPHPPFPALVYRDWVTRKISNILTKQFVYIALSFT